jgi:hypothetical protein
MGLDSGILVFGVSKNIITNKSLNFFFGGNWSKFQIDDSKMEKIFFIELHG